MSIFMSFLFAIAFVTVIIVLTVIISTLISKIKGEEIIPEEECQIIDINSRLESRIEENVFNSLSLEEQILYIERENEEFKEHLALLRRKNREKKKESAFAVVRFFPWLVRKFFDRYYLVIE